MNREEIMKAIQDLSGSQGMYSRLYRNLIDLKQDDPIKYDEVMTELESQNFKDPVDMVLYFET